MCDQQRLRPALTYAQSDHSLCLSLEYSMISKLLTKHHLDFLNLKGSCTGSSESTLVKTPHCPKKHVVAHKLNMYTFYHRSSKSAIKERILHKCSCLIEFIKQVGEKPQILSIFCNKFNKYYRSTNVRF